MTKFAQLIAQRNQNKAELDNKAIEIIQNFLDNLDQRYEAPVIWVTDDKNPQIIIELTTDDADLKVALRRWRLRPFDLVETLEKNGYPMRDIRYTDEINEVRVWLKK